MLSPLFFIIFMYLLVPLVIMFFALGDRYVTFDNALILMILPLVFGLPALYLHLSYYLRNRGMSFRVSNEGILMAKDGIDVFYGIDDFDFIEFVMTKKKRYERGYRSLPFDYYYHAHIHLKNSEYFIITSLYPKNIENVLNNAFKDVASIKYNDCFYPYILDYKVY